MLKLTESTALKCSGFESHPEVEMYSFSTFLTSNKGGWLYSILCFSARIAGVTTSSKTVLLRTSVIVGNILRRTFSDGLELISAFVYSCSGVLKIWSTVFCSTIAPLYITKTRSAISEINAKSCVIKTILILFSACNSFNKAIISFCTVTSSAVVGSSAISISGLQAIAIAIITRCFCPPEIS